MATEQDIKLKARILDLEGDLKSEGERIEDLEEINSSLRIHYDKSESHVAELEAELLASKREANDLRLELISADIHGTD
jgi:allophanate hydrolase subunit 1